MNIATLHLCLPIVIAITIATSIAPASAELLNLTDRNSPRPQTTNGVPHVQIGVDPVPEISSELLRRVSNIPGVEIGDSVVSLRGSIGFWVSEDIKIARPEVIVAGREFAHLHPDGSLHASLSPKLANEAVVTGWSIYHPWADQRPGWEGFVMIYTPPPIIGMPRLPSTPARPGKMCMSRSLARTILSKAARPCGLHANTNASFSMARTCVPHRITRRLGN